MIAGIARSQIVASDGGGCIQTADVWNPAGTVGARNTYLSMVHNGNLPVRVIWVTGQNRWVIEADTDIDGVFEIQLYYNTFASSPNPPNISTGTWVDLNTGCGPLVQFSGAYTQSASTLPVKLEFFRAAYDNNSLLVSWRTSAETNNKEFILQRSVNGIQFRDLTTIPTAALNGTSTSDLDYAFTDQNPQQGVNYYRLVQIDIDGKREVSSTVTVTSNGISKLSAYPSPVKDQLYLKGLPAAGQENYVIVNSTGITVMRGSRITNNKIDVSRLSPGMYYLTVNRQSIRIIKE